MVIYNPKEWFTFIFKLHKSDTVRKLFPMMIAIGIYAWAVAYVELNYVRIYNREYLKNLPILHSLLGFVISLLLVFRTNSAYDRWWEGRKAWGELVNTSRNLALKIQALSGEISKGEKVFFSKMIPAYAKFLRAHLLLEKVRLSLDEIDHPELKKIDAVKHLPNQVARIMTSRIYRLHQTGKINGHELQTLIPDLQSFTNVCGVCERIKNTPIPFSYSLFIKKFIFFYVMTLPLGFVFSLGYFIIPVVIFVFYVLASIEIIAEEIEDPFGMDSNDLPLQKISENIEMHVKEILNG